jgi:hypothetical protein
MIQGRGLRRPYFFKNVIDRLIDRAVSIAHHSASDLENGGRCPPLQSWSKLTT